jgi:hypothetical protein
VATKDCETWVGFNPCITFYLCLTPPMNLLLSWSLGLLVVKNSLKAFKFDAPSLTKALGLLPVSYLPSLKSGFMLPVYFVSATC